MSKVDLKDWMGEVTIAGLGTFKAGFQEDGSDALKIVWQDNRKVNAASLPRYLFSDKPFRITGTKTEEVA